MSDFKLKLEQFKKGSIIFVEGSKNIENFYIIKSGKVRITRNVEIIDDPSKSLLKEGDYFGVVSCIGKRPRLETIVALTDVVLISVKYDQFEELIRRNNTVALKILKLYSQRLREFDDAIARLSLKKPIPHSPESIFNIGLYYYNNNSYKEARYAFTKFTKYCPSSPLVLKAQQYLTEINNILKDVKEYVQETPIIRKYFDRSILFCEYEPGDEVFVIQDGKVKITRVIGNNEVLLAVLNPGDILGEMALIENKPRSATAIAFGDTTTLVINRQNFMVMVQNNPQIVVKILYLLSERIWTAYKQLENIMISDPYGRLLDILFINIEKKRVEVLPRKPFQFDFGPEELFSMAGLDKNKDYQILKRLLEEPYIKIEDGKIVFTDIDVLAKTVEGYRKKISKEIQSK
jgi:CRP/FNR family transcriptional regulator